MIYSYSLKCLLILDSFYCTLFQKIKLLFVSNVITSGITLLFWWSNTMHLSKLDSLISIEESTQIKINISPMELQFPYITAQISHCTSLASSHNSLHATRFISILGNPNLYHFYAMSLRSMQMVNKITSNTILMMKAMENRNITLKIKTLPFNRLSNLQGQILLHTCLIGTVYLLINYCLWLIFTLNVKKDKLHLVLYSHFASYRLSNLKDNVWLRPILVIAHRSNKRTYACITINHSHLRSLYSSTLSRRKNILTIPNTVFVQKRFGGNKTVIETAVKGAETLAAVSPKSPSNAKFIASATSDAVNSPPSPTSVINNSIQSSSVEHNVSVTENNIKLPESNLTLLKPGDMHFISENIQQSDNVTSGVQNSFGLTNTLKNFWGNTKEEASQNVMNDTENITANTTLQEREETTSTRFLGGSFGNTDFQCAPHVEQFIKENNLIDHANIIVASSDEHTKIIGYLTSDKHGTSDGKVNNIRISNVKFNGNFTPESVPKPSGNKKAFSDNYGNSVQKTIDVTKSEHPINTNPGTLFNDDFGDFIPSKIKGGQYVRTFKKPIEVDSDSLKALGYQEDPSITEYLNTMDIRDEIADLYEQVKDKKTIKLSSNDVTEDVFLKKKNTDKEISLKKDNANNNIFSDEVN
jgi:hypothetical protein